MTSAGHHSMIGGKKTPSVTDYAGFSNSAFFFDAIDNAGIGVHASTLPVAYNMPQWKNLAPMAATFAYNTDLDVSGMTPSAKSMEFTSGDAWAGWGFLLNTSKVSNANAQSLLADLFADTSITPNGTQYTAELLTRNDDAPTGTVPCIAGANERALYYTWGAPTSTNNTFLLRFAENRNGSVTQVYQKISQLPQTPGYKHVAFQQSASGTKIWVNGVNVFNRTDYPGTPFLSTMVALKRANSTQSATNVPSGGFYRLALTPHLLTDAQIAANYEIDKARFGLT